MYKNILFYFILHYFNETNMASKIDLKEWKGKINVWKVINKRYTLFNDSPNLILLRKNMVFIVDSSNWIKVYLKRLLFFKLI